MANVLIDIAAEFTGNKAFKQAETSTEKLTRNVKKLAGAVGLAFSATAIINFGKLAVKASLEQQAEQHRLNQLLKVGVGASTQEVAILNEQAAALEKIGVVTGGNITQTQSQLATFNLQVDTIKALTPAILDYVTAEKGATASTADFKSMTNGLAQALNGNFASLTRVGFVLDENTKKQISNGTEAERANALVKVLNSTYKDFNKNLRDTDAGQMQVLANAAQDATTIIGKGLIDALKKLGDEDSVDNLATQMQNVAIYTADVIRGIGNLIEKLEGLPGVGSLDVGMIPILGSYIEMLNAAGKASTNGASGISAQGLADLARLQSQYTTKTLAAKKKLTSEETKALAAAKLKLAIDKANFALLTGEGFFDLEKIQIAAALTNQAELLGKATTDTQRLQIANDTARLNVKQSMLELEDAIASKDQEAIVAATAKLNEDLKILSTLQSQKFTMIDIESILEGLEPEELIDQDNLDDAMRKIREILALLAEMNRLSVLKIDTSAKLGTGIPVGDYIAPISRELGITASTDALLEYAAAASARADAFSYLLDLQSTADLQALSSSSLATASMAGIVNVSDIARSSLLQGLSQGAGVSGAVSGSRYAAQAANAYNITIQANTIANPNELTNLIQDAIITINSRGDALVPAGTL
jgi:hypothetical protein